MRARKQFKEAYIRLEENEPALVDTVCYGGMIGISARLPLEGLDKVSLEVKPVQAVRIERRLRAMGQSTS